MQIAVLSDIHANALALEAVHRDATARGAESFWFLGDVVGYGSQPGLCLDWLRTTVGPQEWVLGNHDAMLAGLVSETDLADTSDEAKQAIELNRQALDQNAEAMAFYKREFTAERSEPRAHLRDGMYFALVHASRANKQHIFRYIYPWQTDIYLPAEFDVLSDQAAKTGRPQVQLFGHTHVPTLVFALRQSDGYAIETTPVIPGKSYALHADLTLINPGSVGQPRDLNKNAAYAVLDTAARVVTFHRVAYDWRDAMRLINGNYPAGIIRRLYTAEMTETAPDTWRRHFESVSNYHDELEEQATADPDVGWRQESN